MRTIITCSWLGTTFEYKQYIKAKFSEKTFWKNVFDLQKMRKMYTAGYNGAQMDGNDFPSKIDMLIFKAIFYLDKFIRQNFCSQSLNFVPAS